MASAETVGLIGAGRVGTTLSAALLRAGHPIEAIWDPSPHAIEVASPYLGTPAALRSPEEVAECCDWLILAVPDDTLAGVVQQLAAPSVHLQPNAVFHVSGRYGCAILDPFVSRGVLGVAVHPAMPFTADIEGQLARMNDGTHFALTAEPEGVEVGCQFIRDLGGTQFRVPESNRSLYHAGLAHGSNHLVTLVSQTMSILRAAEIPEPAQVVRDLLNAALENALEHGPHAATGPVVRADIGTVEEHLRVLTRSIPTVVPSYRELSLEGARLAEQVGSITSDQRNGLVRVLKA